VRLELHGRRIYFPLFNQLIIYNRIRATSVGGKSIYMFTHLYFVRHAHSAYTPDEYGRPLSERGQADAKKVTAILEKEKLDAVISSPYKRAVQTVEGIAACIGKEIAIEPAFRERKLSAKPVTNFDQAIEKVWRNFRFSWEGGESNLAAQERGVQATLQVLEKYAGQNIVIGTHGNLMVLIMNYFDKRFDFHFWRALDMPDIYRLTFQCTSLKGVKRIWHRSSGGF